MAGRSAQLIQTGEGDSQEAPADTSVPGLALIPPKLVQKILKGDYVEMHELLQDSWRLDQQSDSCCKSARPKRGLITDIALWTECYASLVAVLVTTHPQKAPQFMGYLRTIVRASRTFEGSAWASYDAAFRRQAANRKSLDWATIDPTIYNEAFTGRAKHLARCRYCLADTHSAYDCPYGPGEDQPPQKLPRWSQGTPASSPRGERGSSRSIELCGLFNKPDGNRCSFKWCRYAHICAKCRRGPHPASECGRADSRNTALPSSGGKEDQRPNTNRGRQ